MNAHRTPTGADRSPIPAKKRRSWLAPAVTGVVALVVGFAAGTAGDRVAETRAHAETVEPTTPVACIEALDAAQEIFGHTADFQDLSAQSTTVYIDALDAAISWDVAGIEDATARTVEITGQMDEVNAAIEGVDFLGPNDECRAAANGEG